MKTIRLTMAEALVRYLAAQRTEIDGKETTLFAGVFAIFGHGNVAGMGPALHACRRALPTFRAHNEQAMAHAAIAFAKTCARRRMMACTSSIGPGATNMVTAAALAHVNRLPVLLLPGDVFASRRPDPVLQQIEQPQDANVSANDCFRPVSRFFDRIMRPEQLLASLPQALRVLTDPAECGPVTLALPQDVQAEGYDYPASFFEPRVHRLHRAGPDARAVDAAVAAIRRAKRPMIVAGGGVKYSLAEQALAEFAEAHGIPVTETQAGKGALAWDHPNNAGAIGVTGTGVANALAKEADLVLAVGTRLGDFASGSRALFANPKVTLVGLNVAGFDATKHMALPLVADARRGLKHLALALLGWRAPDAWTGKAKRLGASWTKIADRALAAPRSGKALPTDAQVLGAVNRAAGRDGIVVCAAGGLPGELHKLWRAVDAASYHVEYGYSCMGYEIAGGLGVKMAAPSREVFVMVGDGSYLMMNSEIATAVAMGRKLTVVLLDNRGFGCIHRLQTLGCGLDKFNNLLDDRAQAIDFTAHLKSLGAEAEKVADVGGLEQALERARASRTTYAIVIDTDPERGTAEGGAWWDVPVSGKARGGYEKARAKQRLA